jgi:hypothetical protein
VTGSTVLGYEGQKGAKDGEEENNNGVEEVEQERAREGDDEIQSMGMGMDISEGHAVWA